MCQTTKWNTAIVSERGLTFRFLTEPIESLCTQQNSYKRKQRFQDAWSAWHVLLIKHYCLRFVNIFIIMEFYIYAFIMYISLKIRYRFLAMQINKSIQTRTTQSNQVFIQHSLIRVIFTVTKLWNSLPCYITSTHRSTAILAPFIFIL